MKKCDGTELLSSKTMSCASKDYFCVEGYTDGDAVFVDVTSDTYSSEVSWKFYKSDDTEVIFYNSENQVTDGTSCQYVKSTTDTCSDFSSSNPSCTSRRLSSNKNFTSLSGPNSRQTPKK